MKTPTHTCHAYGCKTGVPPEMLMCKRHWFMVSPITRRAVWNAYRPGQCETKDPSTEWFIAATTAQAEVAERELEFDRAAKYRAEVKEWETRLTRKASP